MSIKGSSHAHFRAALRSGNLLRIQAAAAELAGGVTLADALRICVLMSAQDDERFDRAAARWVARLTLERPGVGLEDLRRGLYALEALPYNPHGARQALRDLCGAHGVPCEW